MIDQTNQEAPWPEDPPDAEIIWVDKDSDEFPEEIDGFLRFRVKFVPGKHAIPITRGPSMHFGRTNIWHVDGGGSDDQHVTVSPSIHFVGVFHSPNPARFRLVEALDPLENER